MHRPDTLGGRHLPAGTRPGPATLAVADLPRVEAFYREILGLIRRRTEDDIVELGTPRHPLLRLRAGTWRMRAAGQPGLYHLAYLLPRRADLAAWLLHVSASGWPLQGAADHAVSEAVYLADPEGNGVEVVADRPRATWPLRAGRVAMTTDPLDVEGLLASADVPWAGAPDETRLGHVHLQVADLERTAAFYADVVGLPTTGTEVPRARFLGAGGYHHHLGLNSWGVRSGSSRPPDAAGLRVFTLEVPDPDAIAAAASRLTAHGVTLHRREEAIEVADPDGTLLVLAPPPAEGP